MKKSVIIAFFILTIGVFVNASNIKASSITELTLSTTEITLTQYTAYNIGVTISPADSSDTTLTWESSNTSVATVNSNGSVLAMAPGTAIITCTTNDGSNIKKSCTVTVKAISGYANSVTPSLTQATYDYLNEIYVEKYPEMALEYMYGTSDDKKELQALADSITVGCNTSKEKAEAISKWLQDNITYKNSIYEETNSYPMDTYREGHGNCLGYAQLGSILMRLSDVPAVVVCGNIGGMEEMTIEEMTVDTLSLGHAWIMVYHDGDWYQYDPLYFTKGNNDREAYARSYYTKWIEGVIPTYSGMNKVIVGTGTGVFYENGKFIYYLHGIPGSVYYGNGTGGMLSMNNSLYFESRLRYVNAMGIGDGFEYMEDSSRKSLMVNDECYSNGWISYGDSYFYARPNGMLRTCSMYEYDGHKYLFGRQGEMVEIEGSTGLDTITFYRGGIGMKKNSTIDLAPLWSDSELLAGREIIWESEDPSIASVDSNGVVTAHSNGTVYIDVYSKDPNMTGHFMYDRYFISVTNCLSVEDYKTNELITYSTHVQSYGWQDFVSGGATSGTEGESKRLEGIKININNNPNLGVKYKTHVQSYGWQDWVSNGATSGTEGKAKRLEAICIELTGADADKYDIYYRVHAQSYGWLGWAKNGAPAGTAGQAKRLEAIQIQILPKGATPSVGIVGYSYVEVGKNANNGMTDGMVNYSTHVQSYGDQSYVFDGSVSGTFGEAKRLEGISIMLNNSKTNVTGGIKYSTHVQSYGWLDWSENGGFNGTKGEAKRLEAIKIELTGEVAQYYDVYYRVHAQSYGWLGWAKNGEEAGTAGCAKRLEGIQIVLLPKGSPAPSALPAKGYPVAFIQK